MCMWIYIYIYIKTIGKRIKNHNKIINCKLNANIEHRLLH